MKQLNKGDGFQYKGQRYRVANITNEGYYCRLVTTETPPQTTVVVELVLFTKDEIRAA